MIKYKNMCSNNRLYTCRPTVYVSPVFIRFGYF